MIVLDASAAVELLLNTTVGQRISQRIAPRAETLHAPHLIDLEVAQCLRRYVTTGVVTAARARLALDHLAGLDLERYAHEPLIDRIWNLRHNLTAYYAAYVALAEVLGATLLTCDQRLAQAAHALAATEVFEPDSREAG